MTGRLATLAPVVLAAILCLAPGFATAQTSVDFLPATLNLAQGESALVAIEASSLPAGGLAAAQLRFDIDNPIAVIDDPNAAFVPGVPPYAPLGGDPQCEAVRGVPVCEDPPWFLLSTGRTHVVGTNQTGATGAYGQIAFGTHGASALPEGGGVIALFRLTATADGTATVSLSESILADGALIPAAIPVTNGVLTINVGGSPDTDGDGVPDASDNCLAVANASQIDTDADGFGNICDPDYNNDGIVNVIDLGQIKLAFFSADANIDLNGDGIVNAIDLGILKSYFFLPPGPSGLAPRPAGNADSPASHSMTHTDSSAGVNTNTAPMIVIPTAIAVSNDKPFELDASRSFDADLDRLHFAWALADVASGRPDKVIAHEPRVVVPPLPVGVHRLVLTLSDGTATSSESVRVNVTGDSGDKGSIAGQQPAGVSFASIGSRLTPGPAVVHENAGADSKVSTTGDTALIVSGETRRITLSDSSQGIELRSQWVIVPVEGRPIPQPLITAETARSGQVTITLALQGNASIRSHWSLVTAPQASGLHTQDLRSRLGRSVRFTPDASGQYLLRVDSADGRSARFDQYLLEVE